MTAYDETVLTYDLAYVRAAGEEIRARLFPRPKVIRLPGGGTKEGPTPFPLPVAIVFSPVEGESHRLLFLAVRSVQQLPDAAHPDAAPVFGAAYAGSVVGADMVLVLDEDTGDHWLRNLGIGMEQGPVEPAIDHSFAHRALFRSIAGVEIFDDPVAMRLRQPVPDDPLDL